MVFLYSVQTCFTAATRRFLIIFQNFVNTTKFNLVLYTKNSYYQRNKRNFYRNVTRNETKQEEIFIKYEKLVLDVVSGHQALRNQRLDQPCDSLTSVKTDVEELKESLSFTQNNIDQRFPNINKKVQSLN